MNYFIWKLNFKCHKRREQYKVVELIQFYEYCEKDTTSINLSETLG